MLFKRIELKGKNFLLLLVKLFSKFARSAGQEDLNQKGVDFCRIRKILVVRQDDRIGNLILTTPLLSALRRFFPQAQIWYLASKTFHTLFSKSRLVDRILVARKKQYIFYPLSLVFFIRKIRKQKFDLALDASDENNFSLNNSFLVLLSGARLRMGYKKPKSDLFLNLEVSPSPIRKHASEMHLDLLRHLVGDFQSNGLKIEVDPEKKAVVEKYLQEKGVGAGDFLVGMHIGGRLRKRWPVENFQKMADWITDSFRMNLQDEFFGAKVIFIWGPEEKKAIQNIHTERKDQIVSELFGLPVLTALIDRCNLFISPDTGAMHLAVATGTPTLALFLDSDPIKFGPKGKMHRTLLASGGIISVEAVKNAFQEMVKSCSMIQT